MHVHTRARAGALHGIKILILMQDIVIGIQCRGQIYLSAESCSLWLHMCT
jgi:hypothetical protein